MPTEHLLRCLCSGALSPPRIDFDDAFDFAWLRCLADLRDDLALAEAAWPAARDRVEAARDGRPYEGPTAELTGHAAALAIQRPLADDLLRAATGSRKWCHAASAIGGVFHSYAVGVIDWEALLRAIKQEARWAAGDSPPATKPPTVWYHGDRSYSADKLNPVTVSPEEHNALQLFAERGSSLDTEQVEAKNGVSSASRVMRQLAEQFPGCVRLPGKKKRGEGYFVRVRPIGDA